MEGTTSVMIPSKIELLELKHKAGLLGINLSDLFWLGAKKYKPDRGLPKGMELYMGDNNEMPDNFFDKKQWKKHIKNSDDNNKKLKELVLWLAGELKI